jgi:hypothetical protein
MLVLIGCLLCSSLLDRELTRRFSSLLTRLLERGLFEPEQGEGQMWGQRNSKYATAVGSQLLVKIHALDDKVGHVSCQQNHPIDRLDEHIDFVGEASDHVGKVVDKLNNRIDMQDVQIEQLANMVNSLVGKTKNQANEIKGLKCNREEHRKVINTLTAKLIAVEVCLEDVQKKAFPRVREIGRMALFCKPPPPLLVPTPYSPPSQRDSANFEERVLEPLHTALNNLRGLLQGTTSPSLHHYYTSNTSSSYGPSSIPPPSLKPTSYDRSTLFAQT